MLNKFERVQEQWGGYNDVIDYWLDQRKLLLVEYCKVAGLSSKKSNALPTEEDLNNFCDYLVDYISTGHFKIYDMVMARWKSTGFSTNSEIDNLYFNIVETTDPLLNFNDKYSDKALDDDNYITFDQDISEVGEMLEQRFEQEDALIKLIADSLAHPPGA